MSKLKTCAKCKQDKELSYFYSSESFKGTYEPCRSCLLEIAVKNPRIRRIEIELLGQALASGEISEFVPKYSSTGQRWLFYYELDAFKSLAMAKGWRAAREEYGVSSYVLARLKCELFSEEEVNAVTSITPKLPTKNKLKPHKPYTLTVESARHNTGVGYEVYLIDADGNRYFTSSDRVHYASKVGAKVSLEARIKCRKKGVTVLWHVREVIEGGNRK